MKLPSNQFRDADLSWPACVVNPVRLMAMFATVQHMVHDTEPALDRVRDF
jgi:hypothetical protein